MAVARSFDYISDGFRAVQPNQCFRDGGVEPVNPWKSAEQRLLEQVDSRFCMARGFHPFAPACDFRGRPERLEIGVSLGELAGGNAEEKRRCTGKEERADGVTLRIELSQVSRFPRSTDQAGAEWERVFVFCVVVDEQRLLRPPKD
jgi:hypothetical protein